MSGGIMRPGGQGGMIGQLPGGMTHEEMEYRQALEYDILMAQHVHQALVISADLVTTCSHNPVFEKMPDREKIGKQAILLHGDYCRMQVTLLESIRKRMKDCRPFSERKDLKLTDIRAGLDEKDLLMDPKEKGHEE